MPSTYLYVHTNTMRLLFKTRLKTFSKKTLWNCCRTLSVVINLALMKVWVRGGIDIVSTNAQKIEHEYHIMIQLVVPSLWVTMTWGSYCSTWLYRPMPLLWGMLIRRIWGTLPMQLVQLKLEKQKVQLVYDISFNECIFLVIIITSDYYKV